MNGITYPWGPLLYEVDIDNNIIEQLSADANTLGIDKDFRSDLAGIIEHERNYTSEQTERYSHLLLPYITDYINILMEHKKTGGFNIKQFSLYLEALWVNKQKKMEVNPIHNHAGHISFVIYLDVPDEISKEKYVYRHHSPGSITFMYNVSRLYKSMVTADKLLAPIEEYTHTPKKGKMFIFPAWLTHYVTPFKSDVVRTSVSGNIELNITEYE